MKGYIHSGHFYAMKYFFAKRLTWRLRVLAFIILTLFLLSFCVYDSCSRNSKALIFLPKCPNGAPFIQCVSKHKEINEMNSLQGAIPKIVHMILWEETMVFRNYLSILSAIKNFNPHVIILHTRKTVTTQEYQYDNWFEKAKSEFAALQVVNLDLNDKITYSVTNEMGAAFSVLKQTGGLYVNIDTVLNSDIWMQKHTSFQAGFNGNSSFAFLVISECFNEPETFWTNIRARPQASCPSSDKFTGTEICCTIPNDLFPADIMFMNTPFGSLARALLYDSPNIPVTNTSFPPIPKFVHYILFDAFEINYSRFLSFLSTQRFVKPDKIFIFVNSWKRPSNSYVDKILNYSNVEVVYYGPLKTVYQNRIKSSAHVSDIVRADVLLRYGGIYLDWDVYWLKPVDDLLSKGYETIASLDFMKDMYPRQRFPDTVNMGVVLARPRSRFIKLWQNSFKEYTGNHDTHHAVEMVYKIYEQHPDLLVIEKRLQVMCFLFKCHPLWLDNYKDQHAHSTFDFTKDAYTVHFTHLTPEEWESEDLIMQSKPGFFQDMGRHILGKS